MAWDRELVARVHVRSCGPAAAETPGSAFAVDDLLGPTHVAVALVPVGRIMAATPEQVIISDSSIHTVASCSSFESHAAVAMLTGVHAADDVRSAAAVNPRRASTD